MRTPSLRHATTIEMRGASPLRIAFMFDRAPVAIPLSRGQDFRIELGILFGHANSRESFTRTDPPVSSQSVRSFSVLQQSDNSGRESRDISGLNQQARFVLLNQFRNCADPRRDHWF